MADVVLAFDPSASMSKGFYTLKPFNLEWMVMEPEVIEISVTGLEQYEEHKLGATDPENEAWVEVKGNYYAVGFLARRRFYGNAGLRELKYTKAIPKVLAMVGAIASRKRMPAEFSLALGMLLPYGEYKDREKFEHLITEALDNFSFRGRNYRVRLEEFNCMPEGAGLLLRGMDSQLKLKETDVLVVMVGYRNASFLLMERGRLGRGETADLGFVRMLEKVLEATSGLKLEEMVGPICEAGRRVREKALSPLLRSREPEYRQEEIKQIAQAVKKARLQYWEILADWLESRKFPQVGRVLLAGGTAYYYRPELEGLFASVPLEWGEKLEHRLVKLLGEERWQNGLSYRLSDAYGYFFYLQYLFSGTQQSFRERERATPT